MGYNWLKDKSMDYDIDELINIYVHDNPNMQIVFNLGVNDIYNKNNYIKYIQELTEKYPTVKIHYLSINPISYNDSFNTEVNNFNNYIKENLPENVHWIDSNTYLTENGFYAPDGVHYDIDTYKTILNIIIENVESD